MEWLPAGNHSLSQTPILRLEKAASTLLNNAKFIGWELTFSAYRPPSNFAKGHAEQGFQITSKRSYKVRERLVMMITAELFFRLKQTRMANRLMVWMIAGPFEIVRTLLNSSQSRRIIDKLRQHCTEHGSLSGVTLVGDYIMVRSIHDDSETSLETVFYFKCWQDIRHGITRKRKQRTKNLVDLKRCAVIPFWFEK